MLSRTVNANDALFSATDVLVADSITARMSSSAMASVAVAGWPTARGSVVVARPKMRIALSGASTALSRAVMRTVPALSRSPPRMVSRRLPLRAKSAAVAGATAAADTSTITSWVVGAPVCRAFTSAEPPASPMLAGSSTSVASGCSLSDSVAVRVVDAPAYLASELAAARAMTATPASESSSSSAAVSVAVWPMLQSSAAKVRAVVSGVMSASPEAREISTVTAAVGSESSHAE